MGTTIGGDSIPITGSTALADIVDRRPGAAKVLSAYGLDFCCGGRRTLADAAIGSEIDVDEVIDAIERIEPMPVPDWVAMGPTELVDHIEDAHHVYLREQLAYLESLADKVVSVHGERHPEVLDVRDDLDRLITALGPHLVEEEERLFPLIRSVDGGMIESPADLDVARASMASLMGDHDEVGELLETMRQHAIDYEVPTDGCASYRALYEGLVELEDDLHLHVHKENNRLFPALMAKIG